MKSRMISSKSRLLLQRAARTTSTPTRRRFSSSKPVASAEQPVERFSKYEYPTRTEAPIITKLNAKDVPDAQEKIETATHSKRLVPKDPFDDANQMTAQEHEKLKNNTKHQIQEIKLNSLPISDAPPSFVPPNVPSEQLQAPETIITTLHNGIRVVSQETYGQMCTMGVLTNVGSRHETQVGTVHLMETMAFGSTQALSGLQITQLLQDWGATRFVSHSREQTLHCVDILRPNVEKGMGLLHQVVLEPRWDDAEEFEHALEVMLFQAQEQTIPELVLAEAIQVAAYGQDQQLGKLHFGTMETIPLLTPVSVEGFYKDNIRNNPEGMVIAGAGIAHDTLVQLAEQQFGHLQQLSAPTTIPSVYRGGTHKIAKPPLPPILQLQLEEEQYCRVALAFPVGGWHSPNIVTACVLQTLLGGGSSFSAGGPGKGMYSRLYQKVLNRNGWMESAEAFTSFADEGGLVGISGSTSHPQRVGDLVTILADSLAQLAIQKVSEEDLSRARNMLKCNVLSQLESRLVLFEDMGRQVLTYGKREDAATTTCARIDAVTAEEIQALALEMLQQPPTVAASDSHLEQVPSSDQVAAWFQPKPR